MKKIKYIVYLLISILIFIAVSLGAINLYYYLITFVNNVFLLIVAILFGTFLFVEVVNVIATLLFALFINLNEYGRKGVLIASFCVLLIGLSFIIITFINSNFGAKNSILYFIGFLMTYGGCIGKYCKLLDIDNEMRRGGYR